MTNPGGPDGFNLGPLQQAVSIFGASGGVPALAGLDQPAAEDLLKQLYVADNPKINDPLALVYNGLRQGVSLPLAILESLVNAILGGDGSFLNIEHVLTEITSIFEDIPVIGDLIHLVEMLLDALGVTGEGSLPDLIGQLADEIEGWFLGTEDTAAGLANLLSAFNQIVDILGGVVVTPINSAVQRVQEWFNNLDSTIPALIDSLDNVISFVRRIVDAIVTGIRGIPLFGPGIANLIEGIPFGVSTEDHIADILTSLTGAVEAQQAQQQNFTISALVSAYRNPTWVCRYPIADVVYPEILNSQMGVFGTTDAASAGTAHTHPIGSVADTHSGAALWSVSQNNSAGSYITIANGVVMDTVGTVINRNGTVDNIFLEVFREAANGSVARVFSTDISASLQTNETFVEATLTTPLVTQAGDRYLVRVRNSSTTAVSVSVIGVQETTSMQESGFFTTGVSLSGQTSYTSAETATARGNTGVRRWFMLAQVAPPVMELSFSDDFNRTSLGSLWVTKSTTASNIKIAANQASYGGIASGQQNAIYTNRTAGDAARVDGNLYPTAAATTEEFGLLLHCSSDFSQIVYLSVSASGGSKIYSGSSTSLTLRASHAEDGTGRWAMYYDEPNDKYVVLKDDVATGLEWTGVGTAVNHGEEYRFGGIRISLSSIPTAGRIDNWTLRDWRP